MATLSDNVRYIKGIGEKRAALLKKLGISTLYDLISYFPRDWQDRSAQKPIAQLQPGDEVCVCARIATEPKMGPGYGQNRNVRFRISDGSGYLSVTYFHNPYVVQKLHMGDQVCFFGKVDLGRYGLQMVNPDFEAVGGIFPIYPLTAGLSQKMLSRMIRAGLDTGLDLLTDPIPAPIRQENKLCHSHFAYENIHFPKDAQALAQARRRLVFEEFFVLSAALAQLKARRQEKPGYLLETPDMRPFYASLSYDPTGAQRRCIQEILDDMASAKPMNRLIQGDVGSGKTLCAAGAAWATCRSGAQAAFMAPTEILAEQHFKNLQKMLAPFNLEAVLLKGGMTKREREAATEKLASGQAKLAVGTHALLSQWVRFQNLALVITDEQHRFGVAQRAALAKLGHNPHVLVMSATPIPRTLALILYGDLDISVLDELPPGRQKVDTYTVNEQMRPRIQAFIRKHVEAGNQVYIVCPMVETSETDNGDLKSAESYCHNLQKNVFPDLHIAFLHGRMKASEKDEIMSSFYCGKIQILVATTVIEVGVDVPNATLMVVENAERFGLSQLHQLRGRVGRGRDKSYCILFSNLQEENVQRRLQVLCHSSDGFEIAEADLKLRGPGDFFGNRQHGLPELKIADLSCDIALLQTAKQAAMQLLHSDPYLERPECAQLSARIHRMFHESTFN